MTENYNYENLENIFQEELNEEDQAIVAEIERKKEDIEFMEREFPNKGYAFYHKI